MLDEIFEQGEMISAVAQQFRVPLHAEHCGRSVDLDRLDLTIVVVGDGANATAQPIDDLMMERVDARRLSAEDLGES